MEENINTCSESGDKDDTQLQAKRLVNEEQSVNLPSSGGLTAPSAGTAECCDSLPLYSYSVVRRRSRARLFDIGMMFWNVLRFNAKYTEVVVELDPLADSSFNDTEIKACPDRDPKDHL